jgi:hypothetical protein
LWLSEGLRSKGKKEGVIPRCNKEWNVLRKSVEMRQEDVVEVVDGKKERRGGRRGRVLKYFSGREGQLRGEERRDTGLEGQPEIHCDEKGESI